MNPDNEVNTEAKPDIKENIKAVYRSIEDVLAKTGRSIEDITVIAVTKTIDTDRILEAVSAGCTDLGENRVQELVSKADKIDKSVKWHMIGSLQNNKVKYIVDKVSLIHSVDRLSLGAEIDKQASKAGCRVPVLVQVNVSRETTKSGIYPEDTIDFINELSRFGNIMIMGLMTIGPHTADREHIRSVFRIVKGLYDELDALKIRNIQMRYLSMGMSNDYDIALEEGSNMIRIGTRIFGTRLKGGEKNG